MLNSDLTFPQILDALKARLNREGTLPGTAVLTGSTRQDALPRTAQALTGRLHTMTIWPLSQGEIRGVTAAKLATLDPTALAEFGHLLETFVVGELRKQVSWLDEQVSTGHWRTHDGDEVDYVIEFDDGQVLAFEVKANERVARTDLKGLRTLRDALGDRFIAGVALSTGLRSFTYEDRIHIMPVDRLWTPISGG